MSYSRQAPHQKQASLSATLHKGSHLSVTSEFSSNQRTRTVSEYGSPRQTSGVLGANSVIQKDEWLVAARRSTEHFKRNGSHLPLVWVLTEGNIIPENAVPFGEDRNGCTMYVARALLEGGLHIGKASPQFAGAVIGFAGKEHIIPNYEVLVCASQLRWGFPRAEPEGHLVQGTVVLAQQGAHRSHNRNKSSYHVTEVDSFNTTLVESDILRFLPECIQPQREVDLRRLAEMKTVVVVDDSLSMNEGDLWEQAREALAGIVDIANQYGSKGSDIHFMHQDDYAPNMQSRTAVQALFNRIQPAGEDTPTGAKLAQVMDHYLPLIERPGSTHEPITVVVITDGLPTDQAELERVIVDAARRLDNQKVKHDVFGIQFVQIGTDPAASELLHKLDDHLVNRYMIRDMVDSTPFDPEQGAFDTEYMLKILLGGIHKDLDRAIPSSSSLLSPLGNNSPRSLAGERSPRGLTAKLTGTPRLGAISPRSGY